MIFAPKRELLRALRVQWGAWLALLVMGGTFLALTWPWSSLRAAVSGALCLPVLVVPVATALSRLYATSYSLTDDLLLVRMGWLQWRIPLEYVESVCRKVPSGDALVWSRDCLCVRYCLRPNTPEEVYVATQDDGEFLRQFWNRAPWLDLEDGNLVCREPRREFAPQNETAVQEPGDGMMSQMDRRRMFPARRDPDYVAEMAYAPVLFAAGLFWTVLNLSLVRPPSARAWVWVAGSIVILAAVFVFWRLVYVRYELADEGLIIRFGFSRKMISYGQIREVYPENCRSESMRLCGPVANYTWTWSGLRIESQTETGLARKPIRIAPRYREQFLTELCALCPGAERRGDVLYFRHADPGDAAPGLGAGCVSLKTNVVN